MKNKLLILTLLFVVLLSSIVSANNIYFTGESFTNPTSSYYDEYHIDMEHVTDSDGNEYYLYTKGGCSLATHTIACLMNISTGTEIECSSCGVPYVYVSDASYDDSGSLDAVLFADGRALIGRVQLPSTSGNVAKSTTNMLNVFQNEYTYEYGYGNGTEFYNGTGVVQYPLTVQNDFVKADFYKNNSVVLLGGSDNRTIYHVSLNGTLLNTYEIDSYYVPYKPVEIYSYEDNVYIVTSVNVYEARISPYYLYEGEYFYSEYCIDETKLCNDTIYVEDDLGNLIFYCSDENWERCDGVCQTGIATDDENITYSYGVCESTGCTNECSFELQRECTSFDSYRRCGNYDDDVCLEWSPITECLTNQYCAPVGTCQEINYSEYDSTILYPSFFHTVEQLNDDNTQTSKDGTGQYNIITELTYHNQRFSVVTPEPTTTLYTGLVCDYQENKVLTTTNYSFTNLTSTEQISLNRTVTQNAILELDFNVSNYELVNNTLYIDLNNDIDKGISLEFVFDTTNKLLTVYEGTQVSPQQFEFFQDTTSALTNDVENINIKIFSSVEEQNYHAYITVERESKTTSYQTVTRDFLTALTYYNYIDLVNTNVTNTNFYISLNEVVSELPFFEQRDKGDFGSYTCLYSTTGCRDVRIYGSGVDIPTYFNYVEETICVNALSTDVSQTASAKNSYVEKLKAKPLWERLSLVMLAMIGVIVLVLVLKSDTDEENKPIFNVLMVLFPLIVLLIATFSGIIDLTILIILVVITAGILATFGRKVAFGG